MPAPGQRRGAAGRRAALVRGHSAALRREFRGERASARSASWRRTSGLRNRAALRSRSASAIGSGLRNTSASPPLEPLAPFHVLLPRDLLDPQQPVERLTARRALQARAAPPRARSSQRAAFGGFASARARRSAGDSAPAGAGRLDARPAATAGAPCRDLLARVVGVHQRRHREDSEDAPAQEDRMSAPKRMVSRTARAARRWSRAPWWSRDRPARPRSVNAHPPPRR